MTAHRRDDSHDCGLPAPELMVFSRGGMAYLKVFLTVGLAIMIRLCERQAKVLRILNEALTRDEEDGLDEEVRGWMTNEQIAQAFPFGDPRGYVPEPEAIAAYRAQINRLIKESTPPQHKPPVLFRTERLVGARLIRKIDIIDLSDRRR